MSRTVALALVLQVPVEPLLSVAHAEAAAHDSTATMSGKSVAGLNEALGKSKTRAHTTFGLVPLEKASATPYGLAFRKTPGYPPRRPAIVTDAAWDTIPPAPNPIPWQTVRSIEVEHSSAVAIGILGAVVALAAFLPFVVQGAGDTPSEAGMLAFVALPAGVGYGVGYLLGGMTDRWEPVYTAPDSTRAAR